MTYRDKLDEVVSIQLRSMVGDQGLARARIVASRAALLWDYDSSIDLASVTLGLWVGAEGDMPDTVHHGLIGLIVTMATEQIQSLDMTREVGPT